FGGLCDCFTTNGRSGSIARSSRAIPRRRRVPADGAHSTVPGMLARGAGPGGAHRERALHRIKADRRCRRRRWKVKRKVKRVDFGPLLAFLGRMPAIRPIEPDVGPASNDEGAWLVKFQIDISHSAAWTTIMDLGYVANWISVTERLPTMFKPVSVP